MSASCAIGLFCVFACQHGSGEPTRRTGPDMDTASQRDDAGSNAASNPSDASLQAGARDSGVGSNTTPKHSLPEGALPDGAVSDREDGSISHPEELPPPLDPPGCEIESVTVEEDQCSFVARCGTRLWNGACYDDVDHAGGALLCSCNRLESEFHWVLLEGVDVELACHYQFVACKVAEQEDFESSEACTTTVDEDATGCRLQRECSTLIDEQGPIRARSLARVETHCMPGGDGFDVCRCRLERHIEGSLEAELSVASTGGEVCAIATDACLSETWPLADTWECGLTDLNVPTPDSEWCSARVSCSLPDVFEERAIRLHEARLIDCLRRDDGSWGCQCQQAPGDLNSYEVTADSAASACEQAAASCATVPFGWRSARLLP